MNLSKRVIVGLVVFAGIALVIRAASGPATSRPTTVPADWRVFDAKEFKLKLPPGLKEEHVQGIDSYVLQFSGEGILLNSDYGWYSNALEASGREKNFEKKAGTVGGKAAVMVTYEEPDPKSERKFCAGIHFKDVTGDGKVKLTIFANCKDAEGQAVAKRILETITFP